jgi:hypothetical protein
LDAFRPEIGKPYYHATTALNVLELVETPPDDDDPDGGSTSLQRWRRWESNPRPRARDGRLLRA